MRPEVIIAGSELSFLSAVVAFVNLSSQLKDFAGAVRHHTFLDWFSKPTLSGGLRDGVSDGD